MEWKRKAERFRVREILEGSTLLALTVREGTMSQGMQEALKAGKGKKTNPPEPPD